MQSPARRFADVPSDEQVAAQRAARRHPDRAGNAVHIPASSQTGHTSEVGAKLYAAKPIQWRGQGELLALPFRVAKGGLWLVIDLWAGFSGLLFALLSLGIRFIALSAETNPDAVAVAQANFPNLIQVGDVKAVNSSMFHEVIRRRNIRGFITGGGSPCQGNSSLNKDRRGLLDPRSQMPTELRRLLREIASDSITNKIRAIAS